MGGKGEREHEVAAGEGSSAGTSGAPSGGPRVAMILAMDRNPLLGRDGGLPWHVPGELAYFKSVTLGKPVLMGRRTHESIGRPLPGRSNIVVTRDADWRADGVLVAHSPEEALALGREIARAPATRADELMVIGGAALCRAVMPRTERLYLTVIDHAFEGDTWLDSYRAEEWRERSRERHDRASEAGYDVDYLVLERAATGRADRPPSPQGAR